MITVLLFSAALLGLLAFFEPCTIATHTLFCVRAHSDEKSGCWRPLLLVWGTRSALLSVIFVLAVWMSAPAQWGSYLPSLVLALMATLYVVSRFVYLPIAHLAFHRVLPASQHWPQALQLGLTLPACTLPLVVIVLGLAITVDSLALAALSAVVFASLFTLPMALIALTGVHENTKALLQMSARVSPFVSALLLYSAALYLIWPTLDLSLPALRAALTEASVLGVAIAFLTGFVFSFNPVSFASVPVMLAYVTKAHEPRRAFLMGAAFVAGMWVTHVSLGVVAAVGGDWVKTLLGRQWGLLLGPLLIVLGLIWPGWLPLRLPWISARGRRATGLWGAFFLAIPFSVAVCPFCTPALMVILTASAAIGSIPFAMALLFAFALGRSIPVILGAWSMGWLESLQPLRRYQKGFEIIAGLTLILTGFYMLNEYFFWITF